MISPLGRCLALAFFLWVPIGFADDQDCMAKNIYWESRNQSVNAMYAVAEVVMSRVRDRRWPDNVCAVIKQRRRGICQFSWYCDGKSDEPRLDNSMERMAWKLASIVAWAVLKHGPTNTVHGALWYHSNKVEPYWSKVYTPVTVIEDHIFYVER